MTLALPRTQVSRADGTADGEAVQQNFDGISAAVNPPVPQARVYNSAALSIVNGGAGTFLTFDSERYDNGALHSTTSDTGRLTAPVTGLYDIGASVDFAANSTGYRQIALRLNGATFIAAQMGNAVASPQAHQVQVSTQYHLTAGDYVEVRATQGSGGALNITAVGNYSPEFWMTRLAGFTNAGLGD